VAGGDIEGICAGEGDFVNGMSVPMGGRFDRKAVAVILLAQAKKRKRNHMTMFYRRLSIDSTTLATSGLSLSSVAFISKSAFHAKRHVGDAGLFR